MIFDWGHPYYAWLDVVQGKAQVPMSSEGDEMRGNRHSDLLRYCPVGTSLECSRPPLTIDEFLEDVEIFLDGLSIHQLESR